MVLTSFEHGELAMSLSNCLQSDNIFTVIFFPPLRTGSSMLQFRTSHFSPMYLLIGLLTPPLLQSEQAQLSQSLPSLPCSSPLTYWLSVDSLRLTSILVPGEPKPDTGFHTWSNKCWIMGNNHFTYWLYSHWRNPEHCQPSALSGHTAACV